ncbi:MAG: thiamine-phosphate kinase [Acidobacteria bacterium 13_1_20CM_2_55_15]|nr:MAG: thiamine-phosphate kinase [Acidobacteria bacterium 13_1_40CM_56_16]OLD18273.1 MAG: thiamine-phosphate kinase [Acidobacteria bacterium 13_1_40CM_3_56_11]OLD67228.1 MAG: thiamine-phosphate kinase [Acidobacteria bacterium 13_1_40CM_2_56_11]OLE89275.1 MAG: thiamine-phosphate kinase [Acidobacteria bacterium 13_1_20CM_2_55_15]PYS15458.1 MAG: thiamine-phosphate kinase [Acidobacteriota bacterium]
MKLEDLGESGLIRKIRERFKSPVVVPIGDDAAVFDVPAGQSLVFCSDLLAENTHFIRDLDPPDSIGYKSVAANVSDVGAMGGTPLHFLISLAAPGDLDGAWVDSFLDGVALACGDFKISLIGGDSSSSDRIFVDVSMIGSVPSGKAIRRSGAKPGDSIYVSGQIGGSALGLECLRSGDLKNPAVRRHLYPEPRHKLGAALLERAHAMIDISDGLSTDLTHIVEESKVSARIYKDRLPGWPGAGDHHILHGGEEYELIVASPHDLAEVRMNVPLRRIGEIIGSGVENQVFLIDGTQESVLRPQGWQHF